MTNKSKIALALLKVNNDRDIEIYSATYPLVISAISKIKDNPITIDQVMDIISSEYHINLPTFVVKFAIEYFRKSGLISFNQKFYTKSEKFDLVAPKYTDAMKEGIASIDEIAKSLYEFSNSIGVEIPMNDAKPAFLNFVADNQLGVIKKKIFHPDTNGKMTPGIEYAIAKFIIENEEKQNSISAKIRNLAQSCLVASTFLVDKKIDTTKFRKVAFYFDTPLLIKILGISYGSRPEPFRELVKSLESQGASIKCFRHTVDELQTILSATRDAIKSKKPNKKGYDVHDYYIYSNKKDSDILLLQSTLDMELKRNRIFIDETPPIKKEDYTNETILYRDLQGENNTISNDQRVKHDVDCISLINKIRGPLSYSELEKCPAFFVTHNSSLVSVAKKLTQEHDMPLVVTDDFVAAVSWIKSKSLNGDYSLQSLLAACHEKILPSPELMSAYISEIDNLLENKEISNEEAMVMYHSLEAKLALMDITRGEMEGYCEGTPVEILNKFVQDAKEEATKEAKMATEELSERVMDLTGDLIKKDEQVEEYKNKLEEAKDQAQIEKRQKEEQNKSKCTSVARVISFSLSAIAFIACAAGGVNALPGVQSGLNNSSGVLVVLFLLASLLALLTGFNILSMRSRIESFISNKLYEWIYL